jgi:hypothetical protein
VGTGAAGAAGGGARRAPTSHKPHSSTHPARTAPAHTGAGGGRQRAASDVCCVVCCVPCGIRAAAAVRCRSGVVRSLHCWLQKASRVKATLTAPGAFPSRRKTHKRRASRQHTHGAHTRRWQRTQVQDASRPLPLVPPCLRLLLPRRRGFGLALADAGTAGHALQSAGKQVQRSTAPYDNRTQQPKITKEGAAPKAVPQTEQLLSAKDLSI